MTGDSMVRDLIILAADEQMRSAMDGILSRGKSLSFRDVDYDIYVHPEKDPGCFLRGHDFLSPFTRQYSHALIMLDRSGCGREERSREELETDLEQRLSRSGWDDRAAAIVIDPELEVWVWSDSPEVAAVLGWTGQEPGLAQWLGNQGYIRPGQTKPEEPKKALDHALRQVRKSRSSTVFRKIASQVSLHRCSDPAFVKLGAILQRWFSLG